MQTIKKVGLQNKINEPIVNTPSAISIMLFLPNLSEFGPNYIFQFHI